MNKPRLGQVIAVAAILSAVTFLLWPVHTRCFPEGYGKVSGCLANVKKWQLALIVYASDNNELLPYRDGWMDAALPLMDAPQQAFICPEVKEQSLPGIGYGFNSLLSRKDMNTIVKPEETIMVYDSINFAKNASDPVISLPSPGRHLGGKNCIAFADGHASSRLPWPTEPKGSRR